MNIIIHRGGKDFGPYPDWLAQRYLQQGSLIAHDLARDATDHSGPLVPLSQLLARSGASGHPAPSGASFFETLLQNLKSFDTSLIFPWKSISGFGWFRDRRLVSLAVIGLWPAIALSIAPVAWIGYWAVALYFSGLWGVFFYYLFKTPQVETRFAVLAFFATGIVSIPVLLLIQNIPPWTYLYALVESPSFLAKLAGFVFAVGVHEELCKAAILFVLVSRPGQLLIPQTVVFYGMMSGLGFGIYEGVNYQMTVNRQAGVDEAYFLNIARLTSLPFLHAVWTGIAGYFISFAALHAGKRYGLWLLAICIPATLHGVYNTFGWGVIGLGSAALGVVLLTTYLANAARMQKQLAAP